MPVAFCRHLKVNGRRCCSPALAGKAFCYYHQRTRPATSRADEPTVLHPLHADRLGQAGPVTLNSRPGLSLPVLEDRHAIQFAVSSLVGALARGDIQPKAAGVLLYGLQVAAGNLRHLESGPSPDYIVTDHTTDEHGDPIALDEIPQEILDAQARQEELDRFLAAGTDDEEA